MLFLENGQPKLCCARKDVGRERTENTFEIWYAGGADRLRKALASVAGSRVLRVGVETFLVRTETSVSGQDLVEELFRAGLEVTGFRDLSRSTLSFLGIDAAYFREGTLPRASTPGTGGWS
jgi:hypothetical protein